MGRITLSHVAADAGVSKATVSMVLNNNPLVATATRERVKESLSRLGYVYDSAAASLRKRQTQAVGMIITTLMNPYFAEFAEGIQAELDDKGMDVLLGVSADDPLRQLRLLRSMSGRRVDGVVMMPAHGTPASDLVNFDVPLLLLARRVEGVNVDYVGGDNVKGSRAATEHMITVHGSHRLAFLGGLDASSSRTERLSGFLDAVQQHGLSVSDAHRPSCPTDRDQARLTALKLLEDRSVDAIICYNDLIAFGVLDALTELGLMPGRDVRVIGFDDIHEAAFAHPPLASVAVSANEAGRRAAGMLLGRITGERQEVESMILSAELKPRASCGC
jgi:LacI family transcriptional regulator